MKKYFSENPDLNLDPVLPEGKVQKESVENPDLTSAIEIAVDEEITLQVGDILYISQILAGWSKYTRIS